MELLAPFALKSFLIAGVTLGLLHLLRHRSASERSMVAHFGLLALLIVPLGPLLLPQLVIEVPVLAQPDPIHAPVASQVTTAAAVTSAPAVPVAPVSTSDPLAWWPLLYGLPAAVLLAVVVLAVLRLLTLRAKASVLVETSWLSALAHAQRRMNFKHGTALLTSSELKSPISWGVLRPVILLNDEAIEARSQAEAIIAHELAHVRGLDWAKLLLGRIVTALFWFNPLVWMLSREAHQLREETADDAVLAADIPDTDYAQLLVGVARHECKGMLLGAHGVAPAKDSLKRRVRRVLDASLPRAPVARGFAAGVALGVIATAAPLAALTFTPQAPKVDTSRPYYVSPPDPSRSLTSVVAASVANATAVTSQVVSAQVTAALTGKAVPPPDLEQRLNERIEARVAAAGERGRAAVNDRKLQSAVDRAIEMKAVGVTPDYAAQIRGAAPNLVIDDDDLVPLKAVGVTPQWLNGMMRAGYRPDDTDDLVAARAVGVSPSYVADLAAAGYRGIPIDDLTTMRAVGVTGGYIRQLRAAGITGLSADKLVELRAQSVAVRDLQGALRRPTSPTLPKWVREGRDPPDAPEPPDPPDPDTDE